ncbi:MAG: hypothetical protein M3512_05435 [Bacteroidota bacterium]|nr:hypothetical protein [Bacteroidota bacterium]
MKKILLLLLSFLFIIDVQAQVGKKFPSISGENYKDEVITIPQDTQSKYTLIGMAYSKKSEDELKTWFKPIYQTFISKSDKPSLFQEEVRDVNIYFLPMFTGVNQAAAGAAKKKMIQNFDKEILPHVVFYKGELKKYKEELDFEKKDIPYFFLLNKEGKIVHASSGAYSNNKLEEILELLDEVQE